MSERDGKRADSEYSHRPSWLAPFEARWQLKIQREMNLDVDGSGNLILPGHPSDEFRKKLATLYLKKNRALNRWAWVNGVRPEVSFPIWHTLEEIRIELLEWSRSIDETKEPVLRSALADVALEKVNGAHTHLREWRIAGQPSRPTSTDGTPDAKLAYLDQLLAWFASRPNDELIQTRNKGEQAVPARGVVADNSDDTLNAILTRIDRKQARLLIDFLWKPKHSTDFDTLAGVPDCFRVDSPSDDAIDKALKRAKEQLWDACNSLERRPIDIWISKHTRRAQLKFPDEN